MNEKHLEFLMNLEPIAQGAVGRNALNFGNKVQGLKELPHFLDQKFDRLSLLELCSDKNNSDLTVTVAILAWGGMRFDHARNLFKNWQHLKPIIHDLRKGQIKTRQEAFSVLQHARENGRIPGLGIGYYTKLICFLNAELNGFILDQWTGKSINLLWDELLVHVNRYGWVTDENSHETYEAFCQRIEELARLLNCVPLIAEERIFSVGGRKPGEWRAYLKINYRK